MAQVCEDHCGHDEHFRRMIKLVGSSRLYAQHTWRACRSGGPETYREQARARTRGSGREDDLHHDDLTPLRRDDDLEDDPDHA